MLRKSSASLASPVDPLGSYEIVKYELVSMERKKLFSGPSLYMPWITHVVSGLKLKKIMEREQKEKLRRSLIMLGFV